jgi:hypothetical protein
MGRVYSAFGRERSKTAEDEILNLHLGETVLPENDVGGGTILTEVEEGDHAIGILGLAGVELEVLEVGEESLLDPGLGVLLKLSNGGLITLLLELGLDGLHVALKVGEVGLLVERGALKTERVDDVVDLDGTILELLLGLLGGSVGTSVDLDGTLNDHGAVNLEDSTIDLLDVVGVGDHLITGDNILEDNHGCGCVC